MILAGNGRGARQAAGDDGSAMERQTPATIGFVTGRGRRPRARTHRHCRAFWGGALLLFVIVYRPILWRPGVGKQL